ncbi:MAG: 1,4-alpha-glucan branching enzyme [Nitrospirae bacterium GWB2_47_37]|nr:MAG: 1,4-alpha-glucan branching enzyme [Nitrospirae bacterium GWA2_46_11]OGW24925.1 MAG: 1,4-alpha-glucan branching enzyme [Nitrospirae bacterium GWB2_47_37]HAK88255.1 1,4-alpha-glucan branching enzyme [Nitrospiraceae bacterium]
MFFMKKRVLTDFDLHLIGEGTHYKNYEKLGAHVVEIDGVKGVHFSVWAPNAKRVSLIGNFNHWDGKKHPMKLLGDSGIWETFIPGLGEGELYKFEIKSKYGGYKEQKADPFAFYFEVRPKSAAIVYSIEDKHKWQDSEWMETRRKTNRLESPVSIYEVHPGSWMRVPEENNRFLTYRELADKLIPYVKELGYTHIELLPLMEHPLDVSWGYQVIGYFAPTSRFGRPEDFMYFIDECHQNGIGVIMDWVPAHFPKDAHGLGFFDGTCLYEHEDPKKGEHKEWGTLVFNYGRREVANYLISNALFWLDKYHIDGLRVDAVASMLYLDYSREPGEWIPNIYGGNENLEAVAFVKRFNEVVHQYHPGVLTIAEESTSWPAVSRPTYVGGLGFSMKWNMGWMHDTIEYFSKDPVYRKFHTNSLTFSMLYAFTENFILPFSHDEVVHGKRSMFDKMPGDMWQKFAGLRTLYGYMYGHPGKKLLFMGSEFGQWSEWNSEESLDWHLLEYEPHQRLHRFVRDLNELYKSEPAMHEVDSEWYGFEWIDFNDSESSVISFIRRAKNPDDFLVFVFNLTPVPRFGYRLGVPNSGFYKEVLNSDSEIYWGGNLGNAGGVHAGNVPCHKRQFSLDITLPSMSVLIFKPGY